MAITDLGSLALGGSRDPNQSTRSVFTTTAVAAGELIVVVTAVDVAGLSSGIDASTYDLRIGGTNGDRFQDYGDRRSNQPGTGSQTGVASTMWWMVAPRAYASGTEIIAKFNSPTESDHAAIIARHFSIGMSNVVVDSWTSNVQTSAVDPPAMSVSSGYGFQCLRIRSSAGRHVGTSANATYGVTADWASFGSVVSGPQPATPDWEVSAFAEFLFTNAPGGPASLTSDPSIGTPCVSTNIYVALKEGTVPITTGVLAATEAGDSASFSGSAYTPATLEAYEGVSWLTADMTTYTADQTNLWVNSAGQITDTALFVGQVLTGPIGVIAATEGSDTAAFAGLVGRTGVLAAIEGADTAAFAGTVVWPVITGVLTATENTDTAAFAGFAQAYGTLAATEAQDTAAFVGGPVIAGTLAATEGVDTADFHAVLTNAGTLNAVESEPDVATFDGSVAWTGTLAVTEGTQDTAAFSGLAGAVGTLAATEVGDTLSFSGYLSLVDEKVGVLDAFEDRLGGYSEPRADSTLVTADNTLFHSSIDYYGIDRAYFTGEISTNAFIDATEAPDVAAFVGGVSIEGVLAATEASLDTAAFAGAAGFAITGVLAAVEGRDTAHFSEPELEIKGVLAAVEGSDTAHFAEAKWEDVEEGAGLENEILRTVWLTGQGGRVIWLENEVEDTSFLQNLDPEMVSLLAEQQRITELRP